ncbi:MAG: hypothetical protein Q9228_001399 [Teloschistes exilis]
MDPYTNTRKQFTAHLVDRPIPENASPEWKKHVERSRTLLDKLVHHPAMAPNLQQTYMAPAKSKNRIYFQWDLVGRTLGYMYSVNPTLENLGREEKEAWDDAIGHTVMAQGLILDTTNSALDRMTESTYPDQKGRHPEFGEEILELAKHLTDDSVERRNRGALLLANGVEYFKKTRRRMAGTPNRDHRPNHDRARRSHQRPRREHGERRTARDTPEKRTLRYEEEVVVVVEEGDESPASRSPERRERREKRASKNTPDRSPKHRHRSPERRRRYDPPSFTPTDRSSDPLSFDSLAKLDAHNEKVSRQPQEKERLLAPKEKGRDHDRRRKEKVASGRVLKDKARQRRKSEYGREKRRVISGPLAEEGRVRKRGGYIAEESGKKRFGRKCWIAVLVTVLLLVIFIPVGVYASKKHGGGGGSGSDPSNENLKNLDQGDIPAAAKNTYLDPFIWYDTKDFNVTYTNDTVGGLSVMGLNTAWDDGTQANENVPALDKKWIYGTMPIRGINIGGWLSIEPFITPSFFQSYKTNQGIIDEYTLTKELGPQNAAKMLEKHYAQFVKEDDFQQIQAAGFDHVRIPYSYWAVTTYPGDPYVPKISWRYLLRAIEYCRKYGLRVNLDLHALPGSQNGWNHSGRQGVIGWLNGTDGAVNAQRSLDIHNQLATFFAQPRYKNVITIYGLANEPKMIALPTTAVVDWETKAAAIVRKAGLQAYLVVGDGFLGLSKWQGQLTGVQNVILDVHQYTIFNKNQINFPHQKKIQYACQGWTEQMKSSIDLTTGFGPTICGEWSQADTDCALYLNNVNTGSRWEGTLPTADPTTSVTSPDCPPGAGTCSCDKANADPGSYSDDYKRWLMMYAEAQMASFEAGWGWFYWTWVTEGATQWSWKAGMAAGILPKKTWQRDFNCTSDIPDFKDLPENY